MMSAPALVIAVGFVRVEHIGRGQQVELVRLGDHVDLEADSSCRSPRSSARMRAVEQADGGEILDAGKAHGLELGEELRHQDEGVGAVDARQHRRVLHHRQHLDAPFP